MQLTFPNTIQWVTEAKNRRRNAFERELVRDALEEDRKQRALEERRAFDERNAQLDADWRQILNQTRLSFAQVESRQALEASLRKQEDEELNKSMQDTLTSVAAMERQLERVLQGKGKTQRRELALAVGRGADWDQVRPLFIALLNADDKETMAFLEAQKPIVEEWPLAEDIEILMIMMGKDEQSALPDYARNVLLG